jgi:hypothetical protein
MLTAAEAELLGKRIETLACTNPVDADGLFLFVFNGEPQDQSARYNIHLSKCEHCRVALEIYRYQRDIARLLGRASKSNEPTD